MQYDKNKNIRLILAPIPIKSLPEVKNVLPSIIDPSIEELNCYDAWKFVACLFANENS